MMEHWVCTVLANPTHVRLSSRYQGSFLFLNQCVMWFSLPALFFSISQACICTPLALPRRCAAVHTVIYMGESIHTQSCMQVFFTIAQMFTMNLSQGEHQTWPWFYEFFAPIISLGSWFIAGGIFMFLIYIYLYHVERGRSWFSATVTALKSKGGCV